MTIDPSNLLPVPPYTGKCVSDIHILYSSREDAPYRSYAIEGSYMLSPTFLPVGCYVSALTWVLYDHSTSPSLSLSYVARLECEGPQPLLNPIEVIYVWKRPTRAGSVLFYLLRYLGIASLAGGIAIYAWPKHAYYQDAGKISHSQTISAHEDYSLVESVVYAAAPALQFFVFWIAEVILQTRIFALYGSRRLAIVNGVLFSVEVAAMLALWRYLPARCLMKRRPETAAETLGFTGGVSLKCGYFALYWAPGLVFELWLAALALHHLRPQVLKRDLITVLVHDSIKYFLLIAAMMVLHTINAFERVGEYTVPFVIAGQTIGGSRLVLHLRRAYFHSHDQTTNTSFAMRTTALVGRDSNWQTGPAMPRIREERHRSSSI